MWLREFRREAHRVSELLFWDTLITSTVLLLKDGAFMSTFQLRGPDLDSALDVELVAQTTKLNNIFRRFGDGWAIMSEVQRRTVRSYPDAQWPDPSSAQVDAERRDWFTTAASHYSNTVFLTLLYRPQPAVTRGWQQWLYEHVPTRHDPEEEARSSFEEECSRAHDMLRACCPEVTMLADAALLTYLHSTVSTKHHPVQVPSPACYLDSYLTDMDVTAGLYPKLGDAWLRCLSVRAYPAQTYPGIHDTLNQLPVEFRACLRYLPLDRQDAVTQIRRYVRGWYGKRKDGLTLLHEKQKQTESAMVDMAALDNFAGVQEAQARVTHGEVSFGYMTNTVVLWDADLPALDRKVQLVEHALNDAGFVVKVEDLNAMEAWLGTIPGDTYRNARRPLLHSLNLAHLFPATTPWNGPTWNTHLNGPPLMQVTGKGHTPFRLSLHADDVGHTLIIGPTGSGKSTLLALIALQFLRYPEAQVYAFDKGQSLRCATYAVGGHWFDVAEEFAGVVQSGQGLDDAESHPWESAWLPPPSRWQCYEMEELLHTPAIVPMVLQTLFREIEARLTGAPTLLLLDEAWLYMDHPLFAARIREWVRTMRKKNASVLFSTQSLADTAQSSIAAIINESCPSRIFLANPRALEPQIGALYEAYGLNERQRELIATATPKRHYYYQGQEGNQLFELHLGPVGLAFTGASRPQDLARIRDVYSKEPQGFGKAWLRERGVE